MKKRHFLGGRGHIMSHSTLASWEQGRCMISGLYTFAKRGHLWKVLRAGRMLHAQHVICMVFGGICYGGSWGLHDTHGWPLQYLYIPNLDGAYRSKRAVTGRWPLRPVLATFHLTFRTPGSALYSPTQDQSNVTYNASKTFIPPGTRTKIVKCSRFSNVCRNRMDRCIYSQ